MQHFIDWVVDNWQFVSNVSISIIGFILLLVFKKYPKQYGYYLDIVRKIKEAENMFPGHNRGEEKAEYVENCILKMHDMTPNKFNRATIRAGIEDVLSTPTKKVK